MTRTIEVLIDEEGRIHPVQVAAQLPRGRALLTFEVALELEPALLSESSLAIDWLRPQEDEAWAHLQSDGEPSAPDEENAEWKEADFARAVPLEDLPAGLQRLLRGQNGRPERN